MNLGRTNLYRPCDIYDFNIINLKFPLLFHRIKVSNLFYLEKFANQTGAILNDGINDLLVFYHCNDEYFRSLLLGSISVRVVSVVCLL